MKVIETEIPEILIFEPDVIADERGFFLKNFQAERYAAYGVGLSVQDNLSRSRRGVLRGLHLQNPRPQGKLVTAVQGNVLDVIVDVRVGSPTFGRSVGRAPAICASCGFPPDLPTVLSSCLNRRIYCTAAMRCTVRPTKFLSAERSRDRDQLALRSADPFPSRCRCLLSAASRLPVYGEAVRILLTGVSGQVGGALRAPLALSGTVIAADRTLIDLSRPGDVAAALDKAAPDLSSIRRPLRQWIRRSLNLNWLTG